MKLTLEIKNYLWTLHFNLWKRF